MKVLMDTSALRITTAGVSNYISELVQALKHSGNGIALKEQGYNPLFSRKTPLRVVDSLYRDAIWPTAKLPLHAQKAGADLIHCPAFLFPLRSNKNMLVTIHDLYPFVQPQDFKQWHRMVIQHYISAAVNREAHILVLSHFGKQEIMRFFPNANMNRVHVVYSGIPGHRVPTPDTGLNQQILQQHDIKGPYILSVSTIEPRKNFFTLIQAFATIAHKIDHQLVLVGQNGWNNQEVYALIRQLKLEQRVRFTGFVPNDVLNNLYAHAECFVFPSVYEGFGFTPLEAMKCNCPVVASDASCIPEVLGNAAAYFDPLDAEQMAYAIEQVIGDSQRREQLKKKGLLQAAKYSWQNTAQQTIGVYHKVLQDPV